MNCGKRWRLLALLAASVGLGACETLPENLIEKPQVALRDVQVVGLGLNAQTFLLSFDVSNPNPFPLPVNHVSYGVKLDGQRFATGRTPSDISVPADGSAQFAISVELDLLNTAPALLSIVREGVRREVPYELEGELGIDIPLTPPVRYRSEGAIRLNSGGF
jgi:LEA14-like dessication related protein